MECGVLAVVLKSDNGEKLRKYARQGMISLNHRGEDAHGISFFNTKTKGVETRKRVGLVINSDIFDEEISGNMLIAHNRYRTSSTSDIANVQPIEVNIARNGKIALSHNGNLTNDKELLISEFGTTQEGISDTRTLGMLLAKHLRKNDEPGSIKAVLSKVAGSYSIAILVGDNNPRIIAIRDPYGYMPLRVGVNEDGFFVASESVTFGKKYLNATSREVNPGEMLIIDQKGIITYQLFESKTKQSCMYQAVYMNRPESDYEGSSVYAIRKRFGFELAKYYRPEVDFVAPIPEAGTPVAIGYSQVTGLPLELALVRDRYATMRSFMQEDQTHRVKLALDKINIMTDLVSDKRILLVDDSLVRGTTIQLIIKGLRGDKAGNERGAREVHVAFACPPVVSECRYGIDMYNESLFAREFMNLSNAAINKEIAKKIGADSVYYNTLNSLVTALNVPQESLCLSCLTGQYVQPGSYVKEAERKK